MTNTLCSVGVVFGLVTNKEVTNQTDSIGQSFVNTGTEALNEIQVPCWYSVVYLYR